MTMQTQFDRPILFQQTTLWSRAIAWGIMGISAFVIVWASISQIDEAVPVTGKLEPEGKVVDVQVPVSGVVQQIHVKEGESVKKGQILISLEAATTKAEIHSLQENRLALVQENEFYRRQLGGNNRGEENKGEDNITGNNQTRNNLKIPPEITILTQNRAQFLSENNLYRTQLQGTKNSTKLTPDQILRLGSRQADFNSQLLAVQLETAKIKRELLQNEAQLASAKSALKISQQIFTNLQSLSKEGAYSRLQTLKQEQDTRSQAADVVRYTQERHRLQIAIAQKQEQINKITAQYQEDILSRITGNQKSIAEIDSQLMKTIVENQKKIHEIDSQLSQAQTKLKYQSITAPHDGTIFDLKPNTPGFVANPNEPILKIVPNSHLFAKIFITNKDIGFVKENYQQSGCKFELDKCPQVDIRVDSYPFQEYGDIKGELISIGSDALPPDQINPYWRFPAKVRLNQQAIALSGNTKLPLQSGMSINANIKLRKRTIISIFTDFFTTKAESFKFLR
ncbi:HlyD family efflux transporter periplasmic adaptor subunit [Calothrix sp. PCC 6303]|uniref:HlyD family efflux transporter periplasmic adaptor subunit n=1 Tax=Calothrix sp. PCC 6303 TaxID=1170562 RepID=UPI0002A01EB8|nr:HlyD family efflux transporter periplasmic adaptor subunit [Calothrix sp. PCC 6303]AFY99406.1 secretion protein HlyD family protein [Calothrix sp. PCC 6303]